MASWIADPAGLIGSSGTLRRQERWHRQGRCLRASWSTSLLPIWGGQPWLAVWEPPNSFDASRGNGDAHASCRGRAAPMVRPRRSFPQPRCRLPPPTMARPCVAGLGILQRTTREGWAVPAPRDFLNCHLELLMSEWDCCGRSMAWMNDCPWRLKCPDNAAAAALEGDPGMTLASLSVCFPGPVAARTRCHHACWGGVSRPRRG